MNKTQGEDYNYCKDFSRVAAIVPAGGCGQLRNGVPKIHEILPNGRSIIGQVLYTLREAGISKIVVVVNDHLFQSQTEARLREGGFENHVVYAFQKDRTGAAKAVEAGLEKLGGEIDTVLVTYADMPLWSSNTFKKLVACQRFMLADVAMVSVRPCRVTVQSLKNYGRILRDSSGRIMEVIEPSDSISAELDAVDSVNPSLYVFGLTWLRRNLPRIKPVSKGHGFAAEFHMPPLISIARETGVGIVEIVADPEEALGVNTLEDFMEVRGIFQKRLALAATV